MTTRTAIRVANPKAADPLELVELEPEGDEGEEGEPVEAPEAVFEPVPVEEPPPAEPVPPSAPRDGTLG